MKFQWETLFPEFDPDNGNAYSQTDRAKVFGGWLVREMCSIDNPDQEDDWKNVNIALTFVPDPYHKWKITENPEDDILDKKLSDLDWDIDASVVRIVRILKKENIFTLGDVAQVSRMALFEIPNFGRKSVRCLEEELNKNGILLNQGTRGDSIARKYPIKYTEKK